MYKCDLFLGKIDSDKELKNISLLKHKKEIRYDRKRSK